jgi:thiopurine S-methyltransferase
MDQAFWLNRWSENRIGFHSQDENPLLVEFWKQVAPAETGRVLVPLCGKSVDLKWLSHRGHDVVGVELSDKAARAFAEEQGIAFTETSEPPFTVFRSQRIAIYVGDFMEFSPAIAGQFDFFYDRAASIALPPQMRPRYARQVASLLRSNASGLLISLDYDPPESDGPPFSVSEAEVRTLFNGFEIHKLDELDILEKEQRFKDRGVRSLK